MARKKAEDKQAPGPAHPHHEHLMTRRAKLVALLESESREKLPISRYMQDLEESIARIDAELKGSAPK